ncbi:MULTISPECIES: branched-chain amino acid ABC transporter permease [Thalassospira]|jgi:branched-chain amino acid transport system permease protein|uniref:Branched-chain amino acid ABC transporter permease n=1 Tax=Thalassospira profundimaris TaxID=502049 RepID=A0A367V3Q6_9PROT|nr:MULTISPECIES: branched-chain amino acid ABC transporter permease [Thalassospira]KZB69892.1 branched-chain amino acid ABC transporter permease [Thalassospira sp. MCCC 1A01148]MBR9901574.1 branched-chain amino acid ABC transporter permease [Rhodospirillales bacterium]RCK19012.1 branched-chain amino acid ABC transporter permease [Thalassospira profundimaris]|tara:strand:- start:4858 stop:5868 length:1011 start_codon:yes stop_codon:yes gene_type:complete
MEILNALALFANFVVVPATAYGAQLALGALGVTLIFGILRFANFAHGELMSFGTMITILVTWFLQNMGVSIAPFPTALLALPIGVLAAISMALVTDRMVFRFYRKQRSNPIVFAIVSVGVMFLIAGIIRIVIGPADQSFADGQRFIIGAFDSRRALGLDEGIAIKQSQVITVVVTAIVVAWLFWFLQKTRSGKAMRAYSDDEDLALLSGINPERVVTICWVIAAALAAIAGTLYGLDKTYKPFIFLQILLPIFAATILGGIGQPVGAILGAFIVAFSEVTVTYAFKKFLAYLGPTDWAPEGLVQLLSTDYKFAVSFIILVAVLLIRPTGIIRGKVI